ncbi:olfactory receptor 52E8-like [Engystomops pustulosus]|uniref:olfactory receptor 52E8-like n=1 Tax=Engystomops pustulosus TaxID=76066 RepID=UPI003AFA51D5
MFLDNNTDQTEELITDLLLKWLVPSLGVLVMAEVLNNSLVHYYQDFILLGFPGFHESRRLLFIPFFLVYLVILFANSVIIHVVRTESSLHAPMYVLISLLSAVNICSTTTIIPQMLLGLLLHQIHISLVGCLIQMFFIYFHVLMDCNILLMMALDRYIAICKPLRYSNIMTRKNLILLFMASLARSVLFTSPVIYLASRVQFCKSNVLHHFACEHMALLSLACGNISKNKLVGLTLRVLSLLFDISFLSISYTCIMRAAFTISGATRQKTLHTCGTHILVILIVFFFRLTSSIVYRVSRTASQDTHNLITAIYLLIPALINPLIYGLRTTEIRHRILKLFCFYDGIRTALPPKLE